MTTKTFTVVGVSTRNGVAKPRFSNDAASRIKTLVASGHTDIELVTLTTPATKVQAARSLMTADVSKFAKNVARDFLVKQGVTVNATGPARDARGRFMKRV